MPKIRLSKKRANKKRGLLAPIVEEVLSQEIPEVSARRVLGRTVVSTRVRTVGGKTLAKSTTVYGKKKTERYLAGLVKATYWARCAEPRE